MSTVPEGTQALPEEATSLQPHFLSVRDNFFWISGWGLASSRHFLPRSLYLASAKGKGSRARKRGWSKQASTKTLQVKRGKQGGGSDPFSQVSLDALMGAWEGELSAP